MQNIIIKSLGNSSFDIFFGQTGWEDWARFEVKHNRIHMIKCDKQLPQQVMGMLRAKFTHANYLRREQKQ